MFLPSSEALESRPCRRARGPGLGSTWLDLDLCEAGQRRAPSRVRAVALDVPCPALREAPHRPLLPALRSRAGSRGVARGSAGRGWALRAGSRRGPRAADVSKDECARTSPLFSGTDPLTARRAGVHSGRLSPAQCFSAGRSSSGGTPSADAVPSVPVRVARPPGSA